MSTLLSVTKAYDVQDVAVRVSHKRLAVQKSAGLMHQPERGKQPPGDLVSQTGVGLDP